MNAHKIIARMHRIVTTMLLCSLLLLPATILTLAGQTAAGQTVPGDLVKAIGRGDAGKMAEYFHKSLEMTILDKEYLTSKDQATRIMENFFKEHPPTGFSISFEGAKEKSKYAIGSLTTEGEEFRVNLFFMNKDGQRLIYFLSVEKESQYELSPEP